MTTATPTPMRALEDLRDDLETLAAQLFGFASDEPSSPLRSYTDEGWLSSPGKRMLQEAGPLADNARITAEGFLDLPDPPPEIEGIRNTLRVLALAIVYLGHHVPHEMEEMAVEEAKELYFVVHHLLEQVRGLVEAEED